MVAAGDIQGTFLHSFSSLVPSMGLFLVTETLCASPFFPSLLFNLPEEFLQNFTCFSSEFPQKPGGKEGAGAVRRGGVSVCSLFRMRLVNSINTVAGQWSASKKQPGLLQRLKNVMNQLHRLKRINVH